MSDRNLGQEMEHLKQRIDALEMQQQQSKHDEDRKLESTRRISRQESVASDQIINSEAATLRNNNRGISWSDSKPRQTIDTTSATYRGENGDSNSNIESKPPMRRIKFLDHHIAESDGGKSPYATASLASNIISGSPQNSNMNDRRYTLPPVPLPQQQQADNEMGLMGTYNDINNNNDDNSSSYSSSVSSEEALSFSGWARVFFQARHSRHATQVTSGATSTISQDTYLYLTIHSTANELRISNTDDRWKPPLIDPPIPLKYFYAVKVPGSHSGAALFLKNDTRRLRKYIFRFEFINRNVHQPPQRYIQFIRSGKAAKKSMRKMKNPFHKLKAGSGHGVGGNKEERKENIKADKRRAQDAFAAHFGTLDELLRESDEAADRFVDCINTKNEEEEELARTQRSQQNDISGSMMSESSRRKRSRPPPPYWGSGFNRPSTTDNENGNDDDDNVDSDSDYSEEDDDELYYDDDNDDETLFDKVQVSTEQTLETLWNHIVK